MRWREYPPYVPVARRRAQAERERKRLATKGQRVEPVTISGRRITTTFWGSAWCRNLEAYSDYANRLPRGRTYVRNGSVMDLQIAAGAITARVSGSHLYEISIRIAPLPSPRWKRMQGRCSGQVGSLVELLQGRLSEPVMRVVTAPGEGLFPAPAEIRMSCSCPDSAGLCKHLAAALYGVGHRLDQRPELLFLLRQVNHLELVAAASLPAMDKPAGKKTIAAADLASVFNIELDSAEPSLRRHRPAPKVPTKSKSKPPARKRPRPKP